MTKHVLFITSNAGIEHDELIKPLEFLKSKGFATQHAAEHHKAVQTVVGDQELGEKYSPDLALADVDPSAYDLLVIAGGTVNADLLRLNSDALNIIQHFTDQGKPIAAICHAPWVFINAERIQDKNLTSYKSIRLDLENAGANWVDEVVHRCNTGGWVLITSRNPDDIPEFNAAILKELS